jgi:hypothetical protein
MAWEGYWSRYGKCNDFNENGLFGSDKPASLSQLIVARWRLSAGPICGKT